jgi:oligoendopeptidase F
VLGATGEFRFQARPFALGQPDKQFILIHVSDSKSRGAPMQDSWLDAIFPEMPTKCFEYLLTKADRDSPHELPPDEQHVVNELADPAAANLWALYQQTIRSTPFAKIETPAGQFDVKKDARLLNANPDRAIRRTAWEGRMSGYASREDIYAGILLGVVRLNDRVARLKHFPDAPSMVYFSRDLDRKNVTEAIATIKSRTGLLKDYQRMRAHFAATTGITDVHIWDMPLPEAGLTLPRMTFHERQHYRRWRPLARTMSTSSGNC